MSFKDIEQKRQYERNYYANNPKLREQKLINKKQRLQENARQVIEYLQNTRCIDCGEDDWIVLEFDHVRDKKVGAISQMIALGFSLNRIFNEIKKCDVRCANCHRRKTANEFGWYKYLNQGVG